MFSYPLDISSVGSNRRVELLDGIAVEKRETFEQKNVALNRAVLK